MRRGVLVRAAWRRLAVRLPPQAWFVVVFFTLLALPALVQLVSPPTTSLGVENRRPAPAPAWPHSLAQVPAVPGQVNAWLVDRFGLREPLIRLNTFLRWHLLGQIDSPLLLAGRHGRVFLAAHNGAPRNSLITVVCGAAAPEALAARATHAVRGAIEAAGSAGFDPTLLLVPTAARLHPQDLPLDLAAACAGHTPLGDAIAARLPDQPMVYPVTEMERLGGIPRHRFHWAGIVPLRIAEALEVRWGVPRSFPLPLARHSESSDLNPLSPGLGLSDVTDEPQLRAAGVWQCWLEACKGAGPPPEAVPALTGYRRAGPGPRLLIVSDSFGDEIAPDFMESFAEVWQVHTNVTQFMPASQRAALARWVQRHFHSGRVLMVLHDDGATTDFDRLVADVLAPE